MPRLVSDRSRGLLYALTAYLAWGAFPIYFKALSGVPAPEVLAHRILWSLLLLLGLVALRGRWDVVARAFRPGGRLLLAASTLLIASNWLVYIWAVQAGRVLEASLGYFITPLVNVLLGVLVLRERLRPRQLAAIGLAGLGVLALVVRQGTLPWLPLTLALSFGTYGLVRKKAGLDAMGGLLAETALLFPLALLVVLGRGAAGQGAFGRSARETVLLAAAGPITALPLVWFAEGVQRLPLSTVGLLQYLTPTSQLLLAVVLYREPFTVAHAMAFGCIWAALALYSWDAFAATGRPAAAR
jgi:chloramphenicol-sensitive protein RarD